MPRRAPVAILLVLACLASAACGAGERADDAAATAERFNSALARDDGGAACTELGEETRNTLEQQEQAPCEEAVLEIDLPRGVPVTGANVYMVSASVDLRGGAVTFLNEGPVGWKVSAAGCFPTEPGHPYDCELEG